MKRDLYVKKGNTAIPTGVSTGDAILQTADAQTVAQLQQSVAALQTANTQLTADLAAEKAKGKGPNTEVWITESGIWTAPVTGAYAIWMIDGGRGGYVVPASYYAAGGITGRSDSFLVYLEAGTEVPIVIGAGSPGVVKASDSDAPPIGGGRTKFGDHECRFSNDIGAGHAQGASGGNANVPGAGFGGGYVTVDGLDGSKGSGRFYGAGGAAYYTSLSSDATPVRAGSGAQGALCIRYYDPNKTTTPDTDQEQTSPQNPSESA